MTHTATSQGITYEQLSQQLDELADKIDARLDSDRAKIALMAGLLGSCLEDYGSLRFTDRHRMADRIRDVLAKVQS